MLGSERNRGRPPYSRRRHPRDGARGARRPRGRAAAGGLSRGRPDRARRRDRAGRDHVRRRAAARLDGASRGGDLPGRASRRRRRLRLGGRPALLEAGAHALTRASLACRDGGRHGTGGRGGAAARPATGPPRCPILRPARDRDPGPRLPRGPLRRARLRAPSGGGLRRGRQLRRAWRHVLLHVDGNGPACGERLRPRPHRGHRERAPLPGRGRVGAWARDPRAASR